MRPRVATPEQLEAAVRRYGPDRAAAALRRYGLIAPIAGASGIAIDGSTPAAVGANTTPSFSPPAGSLIALFYGNHLAQTITSISDSLGTHLTYRNLLAFTEAGDCRVEVWVADCPSAQTGMTITLTLSGGTAEILGAIVLTGAAAAASQTGATKTASSFGGLPSATLTTTADNSWVFGVCATRGATGPTVPTGQTTTFNGQSFVVGTGSDAGWVQATSSPTPTHGTSVTINDTAPSVEFGLGLVEFLAGSSGPPPPPPAVPSLMMMGVGM